MAGSLGRVAQGTRNLWNALSPDTLRDAGIAATLAAMDAISYKLEVAPALLVIFSLAAGAAGHNAYRNFKNDMEDFREAELLSPEVTC